MLRKIADMPSIRLPTVHACTSRKRARRAAVWAPGSNGTVAATGGPGGAGLTGATRRASRSAGTIRRLPSRRLLCASRVSWGADSAPAPARRRRPTRTSSTRRASEPLRRSRPAQRRPPGRGLTFVRRRPHGVLGTLSSCRETVGPRFAAYTIAHVVAYWRYFDPHYSVPTASSRGGRSSGGRTH